MLTIWDNNATQHFAVNDYPGERRELFRTSVKGTAAGREPIARRGLTPAAIAQAADGWWRPTRSRPRVRCGHGRRRGDAAVGDDDAFDHVGDHGAATGRPP
jgi:hypothetical protein